MKYVSINIRTTGEDVTQDQVIEFAAVIEDSCKRDSLTSLPSFHCYIEYAHYRGSAFGLQMNQRILKLFCDENNRHKHMILTQDRLVNDFTDFLLDNKFETDDKGRITINVAGKSAGNFDIQFLERMQGWEEMIKTNYRIIDPSILFCDWEHDESLPSLQTCKQRIGVQLHEEDLKHNALDDAMDVILLLRRKYEFTSII